MHSLSRKVSLLNIFAEATYFICTCKYNNIQAVSLCHSNITQTIRLNLNLKTAWVNQRRHLMLKTIAFMSSYLFACSYNYFMTYPMTRCLRSYYYIVNDFLQTNKYTKSVSNLLQLPKKNAIYNDHYINAIQIKVCMGLVLQFVLDCTFITFEDQLHLEEKFIVVLLIKVHYLLFSKAF